MNALMAVLLSVVVLATPALAGEPWLPETMAGDPRASSSEECRPGALISDDPTILAQRGCCSWHGGICGCSWGRIVCCDGVLSPSCTCRGNSTPSEPDAAGEYPPNG